jgi:3-oxoacyl-[acyl-carrier protein] reductase
MGHFVPIYKATVEEFDNEVKICLNSAFYCIKAVWADMCENKWGRVVNISSVAGALGGYGQASYGASKAGLINLAKTVAIEGARFNITGNAVIVGVAKTDAPLIEEATKSLGRRMVAQRPADPEEIADAVAYLASEEAKYMTGACMNMMGGLDLFVV